MTDGLRQDVHAHACFVSLLRDYDSTSLGVPAKHLLRGQGVEVVGPLTSEGAIQRGAPLFPALPAEPAFLS